MSRPPKPILLNSAEVTALLEKGDLVLKRPFHLLEDLAPQIGETYWVRETWRLRSSFYDYETSTQELRVSYLCDAYTEDAFQHQTHWSRAEAEAYAAAFHASGDRRGWRSPIHMPRWASRAMLKIEAICAAENSLLVSVRRVLPLRESDAPTI